MKFPPYSGYKPSGVEWLGDVPEHWRIVPLKLLALVGNGSTPSRENSDYWSDGTYPWLNSSVVNQETVSAATEFVTEIALQECHLPKISPPAILVGITGEGRTRGMATTLLIEATINQHLAYLKPLSARLDVHYLRRVLDHAYAYLRSESEGGGSTKGAITCVQVGATRVPTPPAPEQRAILHFLDPQTTRLDTLVAKKRELIERLEEKRAALISRAVTRGLPPAAARAAGFDPHPKLKPSGIGWFGNVPGHWEVAQLRRFTRFITSGSRGWAEHYADDGAIFIRIGNLTRDSIRVDLSAIQYVDPPAGAEGERTKVATGDVLFSITAYLGSVAVADEAVVGAYINQHIALVRLDVRKMSPRFAAYAAMADVGQAQLSGQGYGGTKIQLSLDDVKSLWLPMPPVAEQREIADYLDRETAKIDQMVAKVETAIERLQEYRSALITAAVTGKIDVRGQVA